MRYKFKRFFSIMLCASVLALLILFNFNTRAAELPDIEQEGTSSQAMSLDVNNQSWDLEDFIDFVVIKRGDTIIWDSGSPESYPTPTVSAGLSYSISMRFSEIMYGRQFMYNMDGKLIYTFPNDIVLDSFSGTIQNNALYVGDYEISGSTLTVTFFDIDSTGISTPGTNYIDHLYNLGFSITASAQVNMQGEGGSIDWGNDIEVNVDVISDPDPAELKITKTQTSAPLGHFNGDTHDIEYTVDITVDKEGPPVHDLVLKDTMINTTRWTDNGQEFIIPEDVLAFENDVKSVRILKGEEPWDEAASVDITDQCTVSPITLEAYSAAHTGGGLFFINFPSAMTLEKGEMIRLVYKVKLDDLVFLGKWEKLYGQLDNYAYIDGADDFAHTPHAGSNLARANYNVTRLIKEGWIEDDIPDTVFWAVKVGNYTSSYGDMRGTQIVEHLSPGTRFINATRNIGGASFNGTGCFGLQIYFDPDSYMTIPISNFQVGVNNPTVNFGGSIGNIAVPLTWHLDPVNGDWFEMTVPDLGRQVTEFALKNISTTFSEGDFYDTTNKVHANYFPIGEAELEVTVDPNGLYGTAKAVSRFGIDSGTGIPYVEYRNFTWIHKALKGMDLYLVDKLESDNNLGSYVLNSGVENRPDPSTMKVQLYKVPVGHFKKSASINSGAYLSWQKEENIVSQWLGYVPYDGQNGSTRRMDTWGYFFTNGSGSPAQLGGGSTFPADSGTTSIWNYNASNSLLVITYRIPLSAKLLANDVITPTNVTIGDLLTKERDKITNSIGALISRVYVYQMNNAISSYYKIMNQIQKTGSYVEDGPYFAYDTRLYLMPETNSASSAFADAYDQIPLPPETPNESDAPPPIIMPVADSVPPVFTDTYDPKLQLLDGVTITLTGDDGNAGNNSTYRFVLYVPISSGLIDIDEANHKFTIDFNNLRDVPGLVKEWWVFSDDSYVTSIIGDSPLSSLTPDQVWEGIYNWAANKPFYNLTYLTGRDWWNQGHVTPYTGRNAAYNISYNMWFSDVVLEENEKVVVNDVTISLLGGYNVTGHEDIDFSSKPVTKDMIVDGTIADVTIGINPFGGSMTDGNSEIITVIDQMTNLLIYIDSLKVYANESGTWTLKTMASAPPLELGETPAAYTYVYDNTNNKVTMYLPDKTPLRVEYRVKIKGKKGDTLPVQNLVSVEGKYEDLWSKTLTITDSIAGASGGNQPLVLYKNDGTDDSPLTGVRFALYGPVYDSTSIPAADVAPTIQIGGSAFYYLQEKTTGEGGMLRFSHGALVSGEGMLFALVEIEAPMYYKPLTSPVLFSFDPVNDVTLPSGVTASQVKFDIPDNITVLNMPVMRLPETGGRGVTSLYIISVFMLLVNAIGLFRTLKKAEGK